MDEVKFNVTGASTAPSGHFGEALVLAVITLLILAGSLAANLLVSCAFLRNPKLRTNFNCFLLNMSIADILFALLSMSNFTITALYGYYPFSGGLCSFWLYSDWIFSAATENTMMLVSLDRLVSIYCPIYYRNRQQSKYALLSLGVMWIWLNAVILPPLVLARLNASSVTNDLCQIDYTDHQGPTTAAVLLVFWLPEVVTVCAYVLIAVRMRQMFEDAGATRNASGKPMISSSVPVSAIECSQDLSTEIPLDPVNGDGAVKSMPTKRRESRSEREKRAFCLLTYLALGVVICCLPADLYHILAASQSSLANRTFYLVSNFMVFIHCVLNPVLYHLGSEELRTAIKKMLTLKSQSTSIQL